MSRASSDLHPDPGLRRDDPADRCRTWRWSSPSSSCCVSSQPLLALIALAPLPLVNVLAQRFSRRIHPAVLAVQAEQAELATVVEEIGQRRARRQGLRRRGACRPPSCASRPTTSAACRSRRARIRSTFLPALDLLPNLGLIAVLGIGGHRVINGDDDLGQMVEFLQYIALLIFPLRNLGMTVAFGQRAAAALSASTRCCAPSRRSPIRPSPTCCPTRRRVGAVRFRDVRFGYHPAVAGARRLRPRHRRRRVGGARRAPRAAASPPSPACSPGSTTSTRAASSSTAWSCRPR